MTRVTIVSPVLLLFVTRIARMFSFGLVSVLLVLYLTGLGFSEEASGLLISLTLLGDTVLSLFITVHSDRFGRRRMLVLGALLMAAAGLVFAFTENYYLLLLAAVVGVISPGGNEVGPFLALEQASLSQVIDEKKRTGVFAWYNLVGSFATALGALSSGWAIQAIQSLGNDRLTAYRIVILAYAGIALLMALISAGLNSSVEVPPLRERRPAGAGSPRAGREDGVSGSRFGLHKSKGTVLKLSALFSLDSFGGGLVMQSLMAYWLNVKFGADIEVLGSVFFAANLLAGVSALLAAKIAKRIGLINTMVFTHLPSNILLILVPCMPNLGLAVAALLLRFSISQMDVPTRQAYTMAVVDPDERSAAAGFTGVARSLGHSASPFFTGLFLADKALLGVPFILSGSVKIAYDLLLWRNFRASSVGKEKDS